MSFIRVIFPPWPYVSLLSAPFELFPPEDEGRIPYLIMTQIRRIAAAG